MAYTAYGGMMSKNNMGEVNRARKISHEQWREENWKSLASVYPHVADEELEEYISHVFRAPRNLYTAHGYASMDQTGRLVNISGRRRVSSAPTADFGKDIPRIFMFGDSRMFGLGVEDRDTLPSKLQDIFNCFGNPARVINFGIISNTLMNILSDIRLMDFGQRDVIVLFLTLYANHYPLKKSSTRANYYRILKSIVEEAANRNIALLVFKFPDIRRLKNPTDLEKFFQHNLRVNKKYFYICPSFNYAKKQSVPFIDTQQALECVPQGVSSFWDYNHTGPAANEAIAAFIYRTVSAALAGSANAPREMASLGDDERRLVDCGLEEFRKNCCALYLEQEKTNIENALHVYREYSMFPARPEDRIGAIIMNCNPFSNGHVYLVEEALKIADYLYLFIISEDTSIFSFEHRFAMVQNHFRGEARIKILPSGLLMASALTFPEYFNKKDTSNNSGDGTLDTYFFRDTIAPLFKIRFRFLGTEPKCRVTARNNELLKRLLPEAGIKVIEMERKKGADGKPFSASRIRGLMRANDLAAIKSMVPATSFEIISQFYMPYPRRAPSAG